MRILMIDFCGEPSRVQISRALARRGHEVLHCYGGTALMWHDAMVLRADDPACFDTHEIEMAAPFDMVGGFTRWQQEWLCGRAIMARAAAFRPERVICAGMPEAVQYRVWRDARRQGIPLTIWMQAPGWQMLIADHVIATSLDFPAYMPARLRRLRGIDVIEAAAPVAELPLADPENAWRAQHGLKAKTCLVYLGTLGPAHDCDLLVHLAMNCQNRDDVRIVVIADGIGVAFLRSQKQGLRLNNLLLLPLPALADMPDIFAVADVLIALAPRKPRALLIPASLPSYFCAARPLLVAAEPHTPMARLVRKIGAGLVISPDEPDEFAAAARYLIEQPALRGDMGKRARLYAERQGDTSVTAAKLAGLLHAQSPQCAPANARRREGRWGLTF